MIDIERIPQLLRSARQRLHLSQKDAAKRVGVSHRLWAEVEQGRRPNVSFATMIRMLGEVGVRVDATDPAAAAAARASVRRATWKGAQLLLGDDVSPSVPGRRVERLRGVTQVSRDAAALARRSRRG